MKPRLILIPILIALLTACGGAATATPGAITPAPIASPGPIVPPAPVETSAPIGPLPTAVAPVIGLPQGTDGYLWWNDSTFYEIFVRSYADSNGDGIGDLNGLISKLDYLKSLGITGIWLMPIHPSPSYHGYDVTDYYGVNPQYGTLDDFKRLMSEAHARGIRVIIDLVLNHTSSEHPWFEAARDPQSPFRDWYVWSKTDPGQAGWRVAASGFYYGYFTEDMPDLNYRTPEVTDKMNDVVRFWLKDMGVDGFRLDAAKYLIEDGTSIQNTAATHQWYKNFRPVYKQLDPQALTIGEVWDLTSTASEYAQGDQLDLTFNFDLAQAFILAARTGRAAEAVNAINISQANFKPQQFGTFLTNHDQNRVMSQIGANSDKAKVGALLYLTAPGVPFVYYGEEIGMLGKKPDEDLRTPMQWSSEANGGFTTGRPWRAVNPDFKDKNVVAQIDDPGSILTLYRQLIRVRNQHAALRVGNFTAIKASNASVFASLRMSKNEAVLVIINLGKDAVSDLALTLEKSSLAPGEYRAAPLLGEGPIANLTITEAGGLAKYQPVASLPGYSGVIVQLQK
jgi:alpha-amylase